MALTKEKLIIQLQTHLGMTKRESQQTVERLFKIMKSTLSQGEDLLISGFGKFSVLRKKARQGRNPQTKDSLTIGARKVVVFKTSKVLRRRLNSPEMIIHFD
jgi:integration host factor subunit alpha